MLRFLINFVIFGVLFYAIYSFFPETFKTLVSWADSIYVAIKDFVLWIIERVNQFKSDHKDAIPSPSTPKMFFEYIIARLL
jgi:cytosine/uracil/thiamine/allantoin permease